ncbi:Glycosyltransferase involved in cell wall bisynthesis [Lachnospiraceae bacterium]|nr:Glycosyltransferase involved in cell wall bisynthesis [Lachnospiraceae bacterium]
MNTYNHQSEICGLSICIITRDQADKLEKCLKAIHDNLIPILPENTLEIVIVDTGSTDNSKDTSLKYTSALYDFPWINDFAAAKNAAVSHASNDLVLILDTDEYIEPFTSTTFFSEVLSHMSEAPCSVGRIERINHYTNPDGHATEYREWINRLFDRRYFHYEGRIHEQLVTVSDSDVTYSTWKTPFKILHDGYDLSPEKMKEKAERDASLLRISLAETPDDPYLWYQLGKSCFAAENYISAEEAFMKGISLSPAPNLEYVEDLLETAGYTLLKINKAPEALQLLAPYNDQEPFHSSADFQFLFATILMNCGRFEDAIDNFVFCTTLPASRTTGTNSFMAWYNAGVILEIAGLPAEAAEYYKKAGDYIPAVEGLKRLSDGNSTNGFHPVSS